MGRDGPSVASLSVCAQHGGVLRCRSMCWGGGGAERGGGDIHAGTSDSAMSRESNKSLRGKSMTAGVHLFVLPLPQGREKATI